MLAIIPTELLGRLPQLCVFQRIFDHQCLGCGLTTAMSLGLHGDLGAALATHPLAGLLIGATIGWLVLDGVRIAASWLSLGGQSNRPSVAPEGGFEALP